MIESINARLKEITEISGVDINPFLEAAQYVINERFVQEYSSDQVVLGYFYGIIDSVKINDEIVKSLMKKNYSKDQSILANSIILSQQLNLLTMAKCLYENYSFNLREELDSDIVN